MLIDQAKIYVTAGRGGKGCQSLYKDIFHRRGIPDGGVGGAGGDIIIRGDSNLHTLLDFKYNQHYQAQNGKHGSSNHKAGRRGEDLIIKVPVGTIVRDEKHGLVIRDIAQDRERVIAAKGGAGGKGNTRKREASTGAPGEVKTLLFELKLLADAGIIGLPNAGKSTLISRISNAHSKIALYPFTTRSPQLGVVTFQDKTFVAADMPGLIEGAHAGRGLGDTFLRHVERAIILVHLVDVSAQDGSCPCENYFKIEKELKLYGNHVYKKPRIIAANKMDMPEADMNLERFKKAVKKKVWPISALDGTGVEALLKEIYRKIKNAKKETEENSNQTWNQGHY